MTENQEKPILPPISCTAKKDIKSDNFDGITSTTTGIRHFEHQQQ
jgi:hypothetical protein